MLEKVIQNGAQIMKNDATMVPKSIQNHFKIAPKIDAKCVVQKSIKNRAVERQKVAKVTSGFQRCEVSGPEGSLYSKKEVWFWQQDSNTKEMIPTRRWAEGPASFICTIDLKYIHNAYYCPCITHHVFLGYILM